MWKEPYWPIYDQQTANEQSCFVTDIVWKQLKNVVDNKDDSGWSDSEAEKAKVTFEQPNSS